MDLDKLNHLRQRYTDVGAFSVDDPTLKAAAAAVQQPGRKAHLPVLRHADLPRPALRESAAGLDVALIGIPMDLGVSNRAGARFGPRAVRNVERIGPYHQTFRSVPKSLRQGR
jgi:guanidinopropionase